MDNKHISIAKEKIRDFCRRWNIVEFSLFGSVLREDFHQDSDVDVLVTFAPNSHHSLVDLVRMEEELGEIFGRKVEVVEKSALRNPFRRHAILKSVEVVYAT
jgi:predicted nucleotidyltransferase